MLYLMLVVSVLMAAIVLGVIAATGVQNVRGRLRARRILRWRGFYEDQLGDAVLTGVIPPELENIPPSHYEILQGLFLEYGTQLRGDILDNVRRVYKALGFYDRQLKLLSNRRWYRRASAVVGIGLLGTADDADLVTAGLTDSRQEVRLAAIEALVNLGQERAIPRLLTAAATGDLWMQLQVAVELKQFGGKAVPYLEEQLTAGPVSMKIMAANLLGELRAVETAEPLVRALGDDDARLRAAAARALGMIGDASLTGRLVAALADVDPQVRGRAAEALGRLRAVTTLLEVGSLLGDPSFEVRKAAGRALTMMGRASVAVLEGALAADDLAKRMVALDALERLGVVEEALAAYEHPGEDGRRAREFLRRILVTGPCGMITESLRWNPDAPWAGLVDKARNRAA